VIRRGSIGVPMLGCEDKPALAPVLAGGEARLELSNPMNLQLHGDSRQRDRATTARRFWLDQLQGRLDFLERLLNAGRVLRQLRSFGSQIARECLPNPLLLRQQGRRVAPSPPNRCNARRTVSRAGLHINVGPLLTSPLSSAESHA
jgi:hypothetical protein